MARKLEASLYNGNVSRYTIMGSSTSDDKKVIYKDNFVHLKMLLKSHNVNYDHVW